MTVSNLTGFERMHKNALFLFRYKMQDLVIYLVEERIVWKQWKTQYNCWKRRKSGRSREWRSPIESKPIRLKNSVQMLCEHFDEIFLPTSSRGVSNEWLIELTTKCLDTTSTNYLFLNHYYYYIHISKLIVYLELCVAFHPTFDMIRIKLNRSLSESNP